MPAIIKNRTWEERFGGKISQECYETDGITDEGILILTNVLD